MQRSPLLCTREANRCNMVRVKRICMCLHSIYEIGVAWHYSVTTEDCKVRFRRTLSSDKRLLLSVPLFVYACADAVHLGTSQGVQRWPSLGRGITTDILILSTPVRIQTLDKIPLASLSKWMRMIRYYTCIDRLVWEFVSKGKSITFFLYGLL